MGYRCQKGSVLWFPHLRLNWNLKFCNCMGVKPASPERDILNYRVAEKYALIEQWRQQFPIEAMRRVFGYQGRLLQLGCDEPQTENKVMSG